MTDNIDTFDTLHTPIEIGRKIDSVFDELKQVHSCAIQCLGDSHLVTHHLESIIRAADEARPGLNTLLLRATR